MPNLQVRSSGAWLDCNDFAVGHEGGGDFGFTTVEVDGELGYYNQFSNHLPSDASFFPVAVWGSYNLDNLTNVQTDKDVGVNLYIYNDDVSEDAYTNMFDEGMYNMPVVDFDHSFITSKTVGYVLIDEPDMTLRAGTDTWNGTTDAWPDNCTGPGGIDQDAGAACGFTANDTMTAAAPDDDRMHYINYGKEVLDVSAVTSAGDAATFVNGWGHIINSDLYWFTDPYQFNGMFAPDYFPAAEVGTLISGATVRRAANYGYVMDRMRELDGTDGALPGDRKPIYATVEVANPWTDDQGDTGPGVHRAITAAEQKAAVWHSLIAGARGILWFNHNFSDTPVAEHHAWRDLTNFAAANASVTAINTQVASLATVLNAPTVTDRFTDGANVRSMVKLHGTELYVFSASTKIPSAGSYSATFSISGLGSVSGVPVVGESRTVNIVSDDWTDTFANGNAVHIYGPIPLT